MHTSPKQNKPYSTQIGFISQKPTGCRLPPYWSHPLEQKFYRNKNGYNSSTTNLKSLTPKIKKRKIKQSNPIDKTDFCLSLTHFSVDHLNHLVPVVSRLVWTLNRHTDVISLGLAKLGQLSSKFAQVKCSHLLIKVLGQNVNLLLVLAGTLLLPQLKLSNDLVGEGAGHHKTGVSSGASQVHQSTLSQDNDTGVGLREDPSVSLGLDGDALHAGVVLQPKHVDLIVKVTNVANNGIVLHFPHVVNHDDVLVTGGGDKDISLRNNILQGQNLKAFHESLKGTDGINLGHDDTSTSLLHCSSTTLANITISSHNSHLSSNHNIGSPHETIRERVTAPIQVVKLALGDRVIDINSREEKSPIRLHLIEPLNSSGGFLRNPNETLLHLAVPGGIGLQPISDDGKHDLKLGVVGGVGVGEFAGLLIELLGLDAFVDEKGSVTTVVDDEVGSTTGAPVEGALGAPPVLLEGLTLPGEDGGTVAGNSGGGVVLGGEDVAGAPADLGAKGGEGLNENGGLDGHVEGAGDAGPLEGLGGAELGPTGHEAGHLNLGQLDLEAAEVGLGKVLDLVLATTRGFLHQQSHALRAEK